jgi:hypothetical protein
MGWSSTTSTLITSAPLAGGQLHMHAGPLRVRGGHVQATTEAAGSLRQRREPHAGHDRARRIQLTFSDPADFSPTETGESDSASGWRPRDRLSGGNVSGDEGNRTPNPRLAKLTHIVG